MRCPYCVHPDSRVTDSRDSGEGVRRRRECIRCSLRFTTYERIHAPTLMVVKRDGRREAFLQEKLHAGIRLSCVKRPVSTNIIEKLVDEIETQLVGLGKPEAPSYVVGEMVMERLKPLDRVAYIRFASVYHGFPDAEAFREEVEGLVKGRESRTGQLELFPQAQPASRHAQRAAGLPRQRARREAKTSSSAL